MAPTRRDPVRLPNKSGSGYTSHPGRALRSGAEIEPEAVDVATQQRFTLAARRDQSQARTLTRAMLADAPLDVRIARARAQAKAMKICVWSEERLIRLAILDGRSLAHVSRRVEALERRVFPDLPDE